jgi:hypothetical protein
VLSLFLLNQYKGHLENISNNTLIGAVNAYTGKVNLVENEVTKKVSKETSKYAAVSIS